MYYIGSVIAGVLISVMILANGKISEYYGVYSATVIIHAIGLIAVTIVLLIKKQRIIPVIKLPWIVFTGGFLGYLTVIFNNIAFGKISISAILALGLFGQILTSVIFDEIGVFGMPIKKFNTSKIIGLLIVILGIVIMIWNEGRASIIPIILSILTGFTIVFSRTVNAKLADGTSVITSTWYHYAIGLCASVIFMFILASREPMFNDITISKNVLIYTGGLIGVICVTILNIAVSKISSFYMTLALFVGQVFMGIILDISLIGAFSIQILLGGIFVAFGLCFDLWIDRRQDEAKG